MFMVSHPSINKLIINNISNSFKIFVTCANDGKKKVGWLQQSYLPLGIARICYADYLTSANQATFD